MKIQKMFLICLSVLLILMTGCSEQDGEDAVSSITGSLAGNLPSESSSPVAQSGSEAPSDNSEPSSYKVASSQTSNKPRLQLPADRNESTSEASDDYQFSVNSDDTVTITKYTGQGGEVEIPTKMEGKLVTAIGNTFEDTGAFQGCTKLTSVIIPDGVTEIQDNAFQGCTNLKTVTISASVTLLRNCAFDNCPNLQCIYFDGDAPQIANYVFDEASLIFYYHEGATGWTNPYYGHSTETY